MYVYDAGRIKYHTATRDVSLFIPSVNLPYACVASTVIFSFVSPASPAIFRIRSAISSDARRRLAKIHISAQKYRGQIEKSHGKVAERTKVAGACREEIGKEFLRPLSSKVL